MISITDLKRIFEEQEVLLLEYLRKSRSDNEYETVEEVLSRHEGILRDYLKNTFGITLPEENIYKEVVSGETIDERIEMKRMLNRVETGNVFAIVVVEPQRLTRGDLVDLGTVERTLKYTNTLIICPNKIYDLTDPFDLKLFRMELQQGSEYLEYNKMILERGRRRSIEEGRYIASKPPVGYDKVKLNKGFTLEPNKDAEKIKEMFETYLQTSNIYEASKVLSRSLGKEVGYFHARDMLANKIYAGYVHYGKRRNIKTIKDGKIVIVRQEQDDFLEVKGLHQPIIPIEMFDEVQRMLAQRNPKPKSDYPLKNAFAGLMYCAKCGQILKRRKFKRLDDTWLLTCANKDCDCVSSKYDLVEDRVFQALSEELKKENRYIKNYDQEILRVVNSRKKEVEKLEKEIKKLESKLDRVMDAYESGIYEKATFIERSNSIKEEIKSLKTEINGSKIEQLSEKMQIVSKRVPILEECLKAYKVITPKERNELLKTFIERIEYNKEKEGLKGKSTADRFTLKIKFY